MYGDLLRQAARPVILHWLGPMFDPALEGYWGSGDLDAATDTFLKVIAAHPDKVDGIKVSLLDAEREIALRRRLPGGVRCYTGDDFHYPELIEGDDRGFSDALLGIFDPLAPLAADAVRNLDAGDRTAFRALLDPTVELVPPPVPGPDPLLQDGRGAAGLAGGAPDALHHGRRPAVGTLAAAPRARLRTGRRPRPVPGPRVAEYRMKPC